MKRPGENGLSDHHNDEFKTFLDSPQEREGDNDLADTTLAQPYVTDSMSVCQRSWDSRERIELSYPGSNGS